MELRYLGFDQQEAQRAYRFDGVAKGEPTRHFVVTADLALFHTYHVGLQEGPALCARKLWAELSVELSALSTKPSGRVSAAASGAHQLTEGDIAAHAAAAAKASAQKAESRKFWPRRSGAAVGAGKDSPWRGKMSPVKHDIVKH